MIKETFSAIEWEKHLDLNLILCIELGEKTLLLPYKLINILFWAIFNLAVHLRWSKKPMVDLDILKLDRAYLAMPKEETEEISL